jgi:hypothetical protein
MLQRLAGRPESNVPLSQPLRFADPQRVYLSLLPDVAMRCYTTRTLNANSFLYMSQSCIHYRHVNATYQWALCDWIHLPSAKAQQQFYHLCKPLITTFTAIRESVRESYEQLLPLKLVRVLRPMESHDSTHVFQLQARFDQCMVMIRSWTGK